LKNELKRISEMIAEANDLFYEINQSVDTVIGIMDKALRAQGMNADAVTVDCISLDKKIVFLLHDEKANIVDIAFGNKEGEIHSSNEYDLDKLSVATIVGFMESFFIAS
jgi:hypothetical protein